MRHGLGEQKKEQAETGQTWKQWCEEQKRGRAAFPEPSQVIRSKTSHQPIRVAVRGKNQMLHRRVLYPFWIANACFPVFSARVEVRESQENQ